MFLSFLSPFVNRPRKDKLTKNLLLGRRREALKANKRGTRVRVKEKMIDPKLDVRIGRGTEYALMF